MTRIETVAAQFGCSTDAVQRQYECNLGVLRNMLEAARLVAPKKHRGYTVEELEGRVEEFAAIVAGRI